MNYRNIYRYGEILLHEKNNFLFYTIYMQRHIYTEYAQTSI